MNLCFFLQGDFCSASLFEAVDPETSQFNYVMKAEMKALSDVDLDSMAEIIQDINEGGDDGTFAVVYRSLIQVTKGPQKDRNNTNHVYLIDDELILILRLHCFTTCAALPTSAEPSVAEIAPRSQGGSLWTFSLRSVQRQRARKPGLKHDLYVPKAPQICFQGSNQGETTERIAPAATSTL